MVVGASISERGYAIVILDCDISVKVDQEFDILRILIQGHIMFRDSTLSIFNSNLGTDCNKFASDILAPLGACSS